MGQPTEVQGHVPKGESARVTACTWRRLGARTAPVMAASQDALARLDTLVARLQRESASNYQYADRDNAMEVAAFPLAKRQEESALLADIFEQVLGAHRPVQALVIDAGCGQGPHLELLARTFKAVLGLDADAQRLQVAALRFAETPGLKLFPLRLDDAVLREAEFVGATQMVHCVQVLGHVPLPAQQDILTTFHGLLEPKGFLVLGVPYINGGRDEFWVAKINETGCFGSYQTGPDEYDELATRPQPGLLPVRHFCLPSLHRLLERAGFSVLREQPYNWFSHTRADLMLVAQRA